MSRPILLVTHGPIHPRQPTGPLFDVILLVHVACALLGLASVVVGAVFAARLRKVVAREGPAAPPAETGEPGGDGGALAPLRRYYAPRTNWMGRLLYVVPVTGVALVATSQGYASFADAWLLAGIGLWMTAILLGERVVWSGERQLHELLQRGPDLAPARTGATASTWSCPVGGGDGATAVASRNVLMGSVGMGVVLVAAFVVMTARP